MADEYIRKQDVVDAINTNADDLVQDGSIPYAQGARAMAIVVEQMPPADAAPVVRCRDCVWRGKRVCLMAYDGREWTEDDGYCHWGERKEQTDDKP